MRTRGMDPAQDSKPAPAAAPAAPDLYAVLDAHAAWLASDGRSGRRADLTDADLAGADLTRCNLTRAILAGADLTGADLSEAVLDHARMTRARLAGADLLGASLQETDLTWADLKGARLAAADLTGACLADSDLTDARLKGANFTNADLEGADLRGAELTGTVMNGTDLTGTLFDAAPASDAPMDAAYEAEEVWAEEDEPVAVSELPDADLEEGAFDTGGEAGAEVVGGEAWVVPRLPPEPPAPDPVPATEAAPRELDPATALADALDAHRAWLASEGTRGARATLDGVDLAGLSLKGADLRRADLAGARNLVPGALARADLGGATLPESVAGFAGVARVAGLSRLARRLFVLTLVACLYTVLTIATGAGRPLAAGAAELRLPVLGTPVPVLWFYFGAPVLLLGFYLWLQVYLQRLWEAVATLPAVFPDGRSVDEHCDPWLLTGLVRAYLWRLKTPRRPLIGLQHALAVALAWGAAPATLAFLWGAFLLRVGPFESAFHALLAAAAFGFGIYTHLLARRTLRGG